MGLRVAGVMGQRSPTWLVGPQPAAQRLRVTSAGGRGRSVAVSQQLQAPAATRSRGVGVACEVVARARAQAERAWGMGVRENIFVLSRQLRLLPRGRLATGDWRRAPFKLRA